MFQTKADSGGYPPDLEMLGKGVEVQGGQKLRFLRSIPFDPMTNSKEWGMYSMQDDPDSDSWGGQSVFDVYTKSEGSGLDERSTRTGDDTGEHPVLSRVFVWISLLFAALPCAVVSIITLRHHATISELMRGQPTKAPPRLRERALPTKSGHEALQTSRPL